MTTISLIADDQSLTVNTPTLVSSGDKNSVELHVLFSAVWYSYAKSAVFFTEENEDDVYEVILTNSRCVVPHEVLSKEGILFIGVRGVDAGSNKIKTTNLVRYRIHKGAPVGKSASVAPSPTVYEQLIAMVGQAENVARQVREDANNGMFTPVKGVDYWTPEDEWDIRNYVSGLVSERAQIKPEFANTVEGCTDTRLVYVLPDGNIYAFMRKLVSEEVPNCNNLFKASECVEYARISSNGSIKNDVDNCLVTGYIAVEPNTTYELRGFPGYGMISEYSGIATNFAIGVVPNTVIKTYEPSDKVWEQPAGGTRMSVIKTSATTRYIRITQYTDSKAIEYMKYYITLNEPVVLGTTFVTSTIEGWFDTGHAFVPTDYEDRIVKLEEHQSDHARRIMSLEGGISAVPDYWVDALYDGARNINQKMCIAGRQRCAFMFYSDNHWNEDYNQVAPALLSWICRNTSMNKTFFGGDIVDKESTEYDTMSYLWNWRSQVKNVPNHHSVPGNHDDGNTTNNLFSEQYVYGYLLAAEETPDMVKGDEGLYYYIDSPAEKTRYLCLDTAYLDGPGLSPGQRDFIVTSLTSLPDGWHVVAIAHAWYNPNYDRYDERPVPIAGITATASEILTIFDNYNSRVGQFQGCGGKVEFCIGGHVHYDYVGATATGIPIILVETAGHHCRGNYSYKSDSTNECSVSGIIADFTNRKIYVVRVGRGTSSEVSY